MTEICKYEECTGCGACSAICPVSAVSMLEDGYRGLRPVIDQHTCIDCGKCLDICPSIVPSLRYKPQKAYAAYSRSAECRASSASGGVASVLAETVIGKGGVVYGCTMSSAEEISHRRIDTIENIKLMKGSKYVQSDTSESYLAVKSDLKSGRLVLFIGTPCQIAGIRKFIGKESNGLLTVDLCCHGVPSNAFLQSHLDSLKVLPAEHMVFFRRKDRGKIEYGLGVTSAEGRKVSWKPAFRDSYMTGFLSGMIFRENCYACPYASQDRCSDITLADFWGMNRSSNPDMTIDKGISAVLVNTDVGRSLLDSSSGHLVLEEKEISDAVRSNAQFERPSPRPEQYYQFLNLCENKGYKEACRVYMTKLKRELFLNQLKSRYYKLPVRQYLRRLLKKAR